MNGPVVCYTLFARTQNIHIYTGILQDERTKNQIDYIMNSKRWRRSVIDAWTYRCADINNNHILLRAVIYQELEISMNSIKS